MSARARSKERLEDLRFLTVHEIATTMRVSTMTIYRLIHDGELPAVQVGRSYRVREDVFHEFIDGG